ncbi:SMP-30/gluconolactonase/LRE family protein [Halotalea alkalilenta]|uniref:SMP-30/gluconolactonase/LRE family protein n=1 Tax=Halotalea alkalilenta TaxID=376489 RepID=UPI00048294C1|nr:L-dopachrome tautomerase-related protein [Halotalea alkalilenta]
MAWSRPAAWLTVLLASVATPALALDQLGIPMPEREDPRLEVVFESPRIWNGATIDPSSGEVFAVYPLLDGAGAQVTRLTGRESAEPYPDAAWNQWDESEPGRHFLHANALRIGPDGHLWVVDSGVAQGESRRTPGAGKLVEIDPASDQVINVHVVPDEVLHDESFINDIRFDGDFIYAADSGAPGILVFDRKAGEFSRVLDGHPLATSIRPIHANGAPQLESDGSPAVVHADQLEVSPDGRYFYFQPVGGPMARIETRWLKDPALRAEADDHVEEWADTPSTGGTAIDAEGNIYVADTNARRILRFDPNGEHQQLIEDPRLISPDALWIDAEGWLWIPATQMSLLGTDDGQVPNSVEYPIQLLRMKIDAKPAPNDHG